MRKYPTIALTVALVAGCGTIELDYKGDYETKAGKTGTVYLRQSQDVGNDQIACILTAVFYGGWCWVYLGMPNAEQKREIERKAQGLAERKLGESVRVEMDVVRAVSWDANDRVFELEPDTGP